MMRMIRMMDYDPIPSPLMIKGECKGVYMGCPCHSERSKESPPFAKRKGLG